MTSKEASWDFNTDKALYDLFKDQKISKDDSSGKVYDDHPEFHFVKKSTFVPHFTKMKKFYYNELEKDNAMQGKYFF